MAVAATHLADKSALARQHHPAVATRIEEMLSRGLLASCSIVDLGVLFSARSPADHRALRTAHRAVYERVPIDQSVLDRAEAVQALLAERGQHRAVGVADLVIAAAAESAGLAVLHYDGDFDALAAVTGQPVEWVVPRGSVP